MSILQVLGSFGIGAVFGWLFGYLEPRRRLFRQVMALLIAIALVLLEIIWLVGWQAAVLAFGIGLSTFFIHKLWRRELRRRYHI